MRSKRRIVAGSIVALLGLAAYGVYWTGKDRTEHVGAAEIATSPDGTTDENSLRTALRLIRLPLSEDEVALAREALHLADHEMDLEFADAVRQAAAHPQPMSKEAQAIEARLQRAQREHQADSAQVVQLTAAAASRTNTATNDQLDLAKARLELDQDEADDAREDLIHAGGNPQGRLQAIVQQHEETSRSADSIRIRVTAPQEADGLVRIVRTFSLLREKDLQLQQAAAAADSAAVVLAAQHGRLDEEASRRATAPVSSEAAGAANIGHEASASLLVATQRRALEEKARLSTEKRADNQHRLAGVYSQWLSVLRGQERTFLNRALRDVVLILVILLVWVFSDAAIRCLLTVPRMERRSAQRLRVVIRVALQTLGVLLILVIVFGTPSNLGTIIGLAGAGLTVALKDFIVSFVGWLVLMGKSGVRIGDLIEINGVSGEVVELGVFNTVLHETGNWTDAGHPTGRRATFTNSYAIEGHYFNFSTSGQWLWDEVRIAVPSGKDPRRIVEALEKRVQEVTAENAKRAEREWTGASRSPGPGTIAAAPAMTIKPIMGGVEVTLRFITHAAERYEVRAKLYRTAVEVLGEEASTDEAKTLPA